MSSLISIVDASNDDYVAIKALMAHVVLTSVSSDPLTERETLANVNRNIDLWKREPDRCVHLKAVGRDLLGIILVKDFWNLCSLFVDPRWHRQGIGRRLVEAAADRCRGRSPVDALLVNAAPNAIVFYERLGFTPRTTTQALPPGVRAMQRPL